MKAEYIDVWFEQGVERPGSHKSVDLPFRRASARALIVRRRDGAILGALHRQGGKYALPGGAIEDGESTATAILRELAEEQIQLVDPDDDWEARIAVDYFDGYGELSIWHIFRVEEVAIGESEENVDCRWVQQKEEVWHPFMHERLILVLSRNFPDLVNLRLILD